MSLSASETKSAYFGIGRRKTSVAKVILFPGTGAMVVNHKQGEKYLQYNSQYINASKIPLTTLGLENMYDIYVNTHGGGLKGQADAIKLGVAVHGRSGTEYSKNFGDRGLDAKTLIELVKNNIN